MARRYAKVIQRTTVVWSIQQSPWIMGSKAVEGMQGQRHPVRRTFTLIGRGIVHPDDPQSAGVCQCASKVVDTACVIPEPAMVALQGCDPKSK